MHILTTAGRKARSLREFARGLTHTSHPLLVQIIPIRRCNIDCGYCNEYDKVSPPVATDVLRRRIDHLAGLGTSVVAFSGGEPMLHPDLDDLIRHIRTRGMMAGLITNGYFLVPKRIEAGCHRITLRVTHLRNTYNAVLDTKDLAEAYWFANVNVTPENAGSLVNCPKASSGTDSP